MSEPRPDPLPLDPNRRCDACGGMGDGRLDEVMLREGGRQIRCVPCSQAAELDWWRPWRSARNELLPELPPDHNGRCDVCGRRSGRSDGRLHQVYHFGDWRLECDECHDIADQESWLRYEALFAAAEACEAAQEQP
jgi:hypothetical protein